MPIVITCQNVGEYNTYNFCIWHFGLCVIVSKIDRCRSSDPPYEIAINPIFRSYRVSDVIIQSFLNRSRWHLVHTLVARRARSAISDCLVWIMLCFIPERFFTICYRIKPGYSKIVFTLDRLDIVVKRNRQYFEPGGSKGHVVVLSYQNVVITFWILCICPTWMACYIGHGVLCSTWHVMSDKAYNVGQD